MAQPDYAGGSIVNLMASIGSACGAGPGLYPPLGKLAPAALEKSRNLLLMVIDGLGYEFLLGAAAPTLQAHLRESMTSVFPSTTASAISTFFTGLAPQQHALTGWFTYFRELGAVIAPLPFRARFGGGGLREAGIDPAMVFDAPSLCGQMQRPSTIVLPHYIVDSPYSAIHGGPAVRRGYADMTGFFAGIRAALEAPGGYVYAYWAELDELAHAHGIGSAEVAAHLAALDAAFEAFVAQLPATDTTVVVTADHGFVDTVAASRIQLADHPALAATLALPLCGEGRAVFCYVKPGREAAFERYVAENLYEYTVLHRSEELVAQGYFGLGHPHPRLCERIGTYGLLMRESYVLRDRVLGERPCEHVGEHGGTSSREMYVPLIVVEPRGS